MKSVFNGKIVYVHILDLPPEGVRLSSILRQLVSSTSITGNIRVIQDESGWLLTGSPDTLDTIVRLEFDRPVDEVANGLPSYGSATSGWEGTVTRNSEGWTTAEVRLDGERFVSRFEFTVENPNYLRGRGRSFQLKVQRDGGDWETVSEGKVYGTICGKKFDPVEASAIRLIVQATGLRQFDVFEE